MTTNEIIRRRVIRDYKVVAADKVAEYSHKGYELVGSGLFYMSLSYQPMALYEIVLSRAPDEVERITYDN